MLQAVFVTFGYLTQVDLTTRDIIHLFASRLRVNAWDCMVHR